MEIISYIVPQGFFALSQFATFSSAGGRLEPVKSKNCQKTLPYYTLPRAL